MPPKKPTGLWPAEPHTVAKIEILEAYLQAWFAIFGRTAAGSDLLYIDGFAGPDQYTNRAHVSPNAAIQAAMGAKLSLGSAWAAGRARLIFIEDADWAFENLVRQTTPFDNRPGLAITRIHNSFSAGLKQVRRDHPDFFTSKRPLFAFIDPFGPKPVPFSDVRSILASPCSEVLINLNTPAIDRIYKARESSEGDGHDATLTSIFGDDCWETLEDGANIRWNRLNRITGLYIEKLCEIPDVKYYFTFMMGKSRDNPSYVLLFASKNYKGLEKMKGSMKRMDQSGLFTFNDRDHQQPTFIRFDNQQIFSEWTYSTFKGKRVSYEDLRDFILIYTPYTKPNAELLKPLEVMKLITIESSNPKRKRFTYKAEDTKAIIFSEGELVWAPTQT